MLALALPASASHLTGGDNRGVPLTTRGHARPARARDDARAGRARAAPDRRRHAHAPGGADATRRCVAAQRRLVAELRARPAGHRQTDRRARAAMPRRGGAARPTCVDRERPRRCRSAPPGAPTPARSRRWTSSTASATATCPRRAFPAGTEVLLSGAPAFGVDFIDKAYGAFPWLVLAVLVVSYLLLLRAFRSVVLPLKAVVMNLLSVSADLRRARARLPARLGRGRRAPGSRRRSRRGSRSSCSRCCSASRWTTRCSCSRGSARSGTAATTTRQAVAYGLEHTGRIITAAAIIMIAAFSGFLARQLRRRCRSSGSACRAAILLDATVVRAILVPATMKLLGRWNWYLPERVRRAMGLRGPQVTREPRPRARADADGPPNRRHPSEGMIAACDPGSSRVERGRGPPRPRRDARRGDRAPAPGTGLGGRGRRGGAARRERRASPGDARDALADLGPTIAFLAALLVLADGCREAGLFAALGAAMARGSRAAAAAAGDGVRRRRGHDRGAQPRRDRRPAHPGGVRDRVAPAGQRAATRLRVHAPGEQRVAAPPGVQSHGPARVRGDRAVVRALRGADGGSLARRARGGVARAEPRVRPRPARRARDGRGRRARRPAALRARRRRGHAGGLRAQLARRHRADVGRGRRRARPGGAQRRPPRALARAVEPPFLVFVLGLAIVVRAAGDHGLQAPSTRSSRAATGCSP